MNYEPFDIVVLPFPFTDRPAVKRRPALIVSGVSFNDHHDQCVFAMITTGRHSDWPSDVRVQDWRAAGLSVACRVRFKLFTLEKAMILRRVGALTAHDRAAVNKALSGCIASV